MTRLNPADGAGGTKDVFLDQSLPLQRSHPAANAEFLLQAGLIELDCFERFRVFNVDWREWDEKPSIVITPLGEVMVASAWTRRHAGLGTIVPTSSADPRARRERATPGR